MVGFKNNSPVRSSSNEVLNSLTASSTAPGGNHRHRKLRSSTSLKRKAPLSANFKICEQLDVLQHTVASSEEMHPPYSTLENQIDSIINIASCHRDQAFTKLQFLCCYYNHRSETLFVAASIFDRFVCTVKVPTRYLDCIIGTVYFMSAKLNKHEDHTTEDLLSRVTCSPLLGVTRAELCRMEQQVLSKLQWRVVTLGHYHILLQVLEVFRSCMGDNSLDLLEELATQNLKICLAEHQSLLHRPAALVLALLLDLYGSYSSLFPPHTSQCFQLQLTAANLEVDEWMQCLRHVQKVLRHTSVLRQKSLCPPSAVWRKVFHPLSRATGLPTIVEQPKEAHLATGTGSPTKSSANLCKSKSAKAKSGSAERQLLNSMLHVPVTFEQCVQLVRED